MYKRPFLIFVFSSLIGYSQTDLKITLEEKVKTEDITELADFLGVRYGKFTLNSEKIKNKTLEINKYELFREELIFINSHFYPDRNDILNKWNENHTETLEFKIFSKLNNEKTQIDSRISFLNTQINDRTTIYEDSYLFEKIDISSINPNDTIDKEVCYIGISYLLPEIHFFFANMDRISFLEFVKDSGENQYIIFELIFK